MRALIFAMCLLAVPFAQAQDEWRNVLAAMPLRTNATELNTDNYVDVILQSFQSNSAVKGLVFMPGAVDVFFWHRGTTVRLTNESRTLLDAVVALTNQTGMEATFQPPLLLLHQDHDPLTPSFEIKDTNTAAKIHQRNYSLHAFYNDKDWDFTLPALKKAVGVAIAPKKKSRYSYHFYRSSFAAWNLTAWETLETFSLATKTTFTVEKRQVTFKDDFRDPARTPASVK